MVGASLPRSASRRGGMPILRCRAAEFLALRAATSRCERAKRAAERVLRQPLHSDPTRLASGGTSRDGQFPSGYQAQRRVHAAFLPALQFSAFMFRKRMRMANTRANSAEIVSQLRQVEVLMGQGLSRLNAIRRVGVVEQISTAGGSSRVGSAWIG